MKGSEILNAIIVNFRTPDLTLRCVHSLIEHSIVDVTGIVVVENASPDESYRTLRSQLPHGVRLVRASLNRGFGAGVNLGMAACSRELVLVLNPDTYFLDSSVKKAVRLFGREPEVGLVGLDLIYPDGRRQYSARRFYSLLDIIGRRSSLGRLRGFKMRIERHMMIEAWSAEVPFDAEWIMGTGFIVRFELYETLGGMDERYFLYMEDVDLCARVWQAGYRVVCVPGASLTHEHQRQSSAGVWSRAGRYHLHSLWRFRSKFRLPMRRPPGVTGLRKQPSRGA